MTASKDKNGRVGRYVISNDGGERVRAFVPTPLPPQPALDLPSLLIRLGAAQRALGRLDGVTVLLPRPELFLYMYVRKEAVLSSQIEGTQSTLTDLLSYESDPGIDPPLDDVREVSNYVDAMMFGLERLEALPLSLRLIREMHGKLLRDGRGQEATPGEFRTSQNWIGGTRPGNALFVPPPAHELHSCLDAFEKFLHEQKSGLPILIKAGLIHVQFETIHPFLDGNGRIGRLLITLFLCVHKELSVPLLYLSLFFKTHRQQYYELLQRVRLEGAWEAWLDFFLQGVEETANQAHLTASRIVRMFDDDRLRITQSSKRASSALRIHDVLQKEPIVRAQVLVSRTGLSMPTVNAVLADLTKLGIVREHSGRQRNRIFAYQGYLDVLEKGADA